jgi:HK97 family phage major capsid protein
MNQQNIPEDRVQEFETLLTDIQTNWTGIKGLPQAVQQLQDQSGSQEKELLEVRRTLATRRLPQTQPRSGGRVTDDCAAALAGTFILHCERSGKLDALCSIPSHRDALITHARQAVGLTMRAALTTTDIPLPAQYGSQLRELISDYGVVRQRMFPYPIGMGTSRPARFGARPGFGSIAMSAAITEKSPGYTFASLESHKIGGIVRLPRELDEQSLVSMGQFLARYGAVEFARAEDTWGFLADGNAGYESVKGVVTIARENGKALILPATKTKPSDATLDDFRAMRRLVNKAALNGRLSAYYLDSTWETRLAAFRTAAEPTVYQRFPDGSAMLDGYPIVWTDVLEAYGTAAAADKAIAVFGALSFWWFGEHGSPRIDTSEHVWFANDQLAVRFIEEIDFDYAAVDATSVLITAAA